MLEKPSDIRLWLVLTNHCRPNLKGAHTHTHTHTVHHGLSSTVIPMGEGLFIGGVTISQPEHTQLFTDVSL